MTSKALRDIAQLESLEDLYVVCDRFSHSIRTHLGVSMGVLDDLCAGHRLEKQDFKDARSALHHILQTLDSVREMTNLPAFDPRPSSLSELLQEEMKSNEQLVLELRSDPLERTIDKKLFLRALRCLTFYGAERRRRFNKQELPKPLLVLERKVLETKEGAGSKQEVLRYILQQSHSIDSVFLKDATRFRDLASIDHAPHSLGLLFCERVFHLHQGITRFTFKEPGELIFSVEFQ